MKGCGLCSYWTPPRQNPEAWQTPLGECGFPWPNLVLPESIKIEREPMYSTEGTSCRTFSSKDTGEGKT